MKKFNLKVISVCIGVAAIGICSLSLMDNPKNTYIKNQDTEHQSHSKLKKSNLQFSDLVDSTCSSSSCLVVNGSSKKSVGENGFSHAEKRVADQAISIASDEPRTLDAESLILKPINTQAISSKTAAMASQKMDTSVVRLSDTVISVCHRLGVDADDISNMIYGSGIDESKFDIQVGQRVDAIINDKGQLKELRIHNDGGETYRSFIKKGDQFSFLNKDYPRSTSEIEKEFKLGNSFLESAEETGLTKPEASQLLDKLNDRVDFKKLPPNSIIKTDLTETIINGSVRSFKINAVQISSEKYNLTAVNYNGNLYDSMGASLSPSFLRHPLSGKVRVTSHFSLNRMHPILHYRRPHWGTDYGCPIGTPILSISDATVIRAGRVRGFGNMVMLKHPRHIETIAAHMIRIAKGIHVGSHVKKGDVIGYVGKTGLSTGPHLHFEMRVNGKRVDSLKAKLPVMANVSQDKLFQTDLTKYTAELSNL